jgi:hypothetical protein
MACTHKIKKSQQEYRFLFATKQEVIAFPEKQLPYRPNLKSFSLFTLYTISGTSFSKKAIRNTPVSK